MIAMEVLVESKPILSPVPVESSMFPSQPERADTPSKKVCGVYSFIHRPTGKRYIGAGKKIENRRKSHIKDSQRGCPNHFHKQLRKLGVDSFDFQILELCEEEIRFVREKHWIDFYDATSEKGFNTYSDPTAINYEPSDATRRRMSEAQKGNKKWMLRGEITQEMRDNARAKQLGKRHTPETKLKMSNRMKGNKILLGHKHSEETRRKISIANSGKPCPQRAVKWTEERKMENSERMKGNKFAQGKTMGAELKAKWSAAMKGNTFAKTYFSSQEARDKMSKTLTGRKLTEEHKANLSHVWKGRKHTEQTKAKMRATWDRKRKERMVV